MRSKLGLLEAALFTTNEPLTYEELKKLLKVKEEEVEKFLSILREKYSNPDHGIELSEAGGYRLVVKEEYIEQVSHLTPHADLSRGLLRVLSIIAYHEPIKQSDIVKVIGNRTYEYVRRLEERGLIKSEKKSRTKVLRTTSHFEKYFNVNKDEIRKALERDN
jgi:segregation and condensation protein B